MILMDFHLLTHFFYIKWWYLAVRLGQWWQWSRRSEFLWQTPPRYWPVRVRFPTSMGQGLSSAIHQWLWFQIHGRWRSSGAISWGKVWGHRRPPWFPGIRLLNINYKWLTLLAGSSLLNPRQSRRWMVRIRMQMQRR
jgi:hypothetical protein